MGTSLLALFLMLPGTMELIQDGIHWAVDGHTAHDTSTDHHDDGPTDEHGCSGPYHFCICHGSAQYVAPANTSGVSAEQGAIREHVGLDAPAPSTHLDRLFRPPIV